MRSPTGRASASERGRGEARRANRSAERTAEQNARAASEAAWAELLALEARGWSIHMSAGRPLVVEKHGGRVYGRDAVQLVEHLRSTGALPRLAGGRTR